MSRSFLPLLRILAVIGFALSAPAQASTVLILTDTATGDRQPPLTTDATFQNGDFLVSSGQGGTLNDAIEESTRWSHVFSGPYSGRITNVRRATLDLTWRTGNDTPENDILRLRGLTLSGLFAGTTTFTDYTQSFDLLNHVSLASLLLILNDTDGAFNFTLGNDSWAYGATLTLEVDVAAIPIQAPAGLLLIGGLAALSLRRKSPTPNTAEQ